MTLTILFALFFYITVRGMQYAKKIDGMILK